MSMFSAQLSRREAIEVFLGSLESVSGRLKSSSVVHPESNSGIVAYWDSEPSAGDSIPLLIVASSQELNELLVAISASPQAPNPISAFCRFMTIGEARAYFSSDSLDLGFKLFPVFVAMAMAEALLLGEGKLGLRQLSPAICKRTFSFAWGRALAARVPSEVIENFPSRWLEAYGLVHSNAARSAIEHIIGHVVHVLTVGTKVGLGIRAESSYEALAAALSSGNRSLLGDAWMSFRHPFERIVSLDELSTATREERGAYLQELIRSQSRVTSDSEMEVLAAASAFVATQVAPGSFEHAELLRDSSRPDILVWYALFSALQSPRNIIDFQNGLGRRVLRDILRVEEQMSRPSADIALVELAAIARIGTDALSRRLGHLGEIEIELAPHVSSSFTFQTRTDRSRPSIQPAGFDQEQLFTSDKRKSVRERLEQMAAALSQLALEVKDEDGSSNAPSSKRHRRR